MTSLSLGVPMDRIPETALAWHRAGQGAVIATVVDAWGSAPRRAGSQMVVSSAGSMQGSVSGGCVEGAVVVAAQEALAKGTLQLLEFGVSDEDAFAVGLACGGKIKVLLEPVGATLSEQVLSDLVAARQQRRSVAYVVNVHTGQGQLTADGYDDRFRKDRSGMETDGQSFVAIHNPPLRLAIIGAVHIAQALHPMALELGIDPIVIDPRDSFATDERFPGATLMRDWPDEALDRLSPDQRTAVVALTHDPKLDDPALQRALASDAFYIGALGSTRSHAKRLERLRQRDLSEVALQRIHGPVGLSIGAATPAEIALSILAELTQVLRQS